MPHWRARLADYSFVCIFFHSDFLYFYFFVFVFFWPPCPFMPATTLVRGGVFFRRVFIIHEFLRALFLSSPGAFGGGYFFFYSTLDLNDT